jgi:hypothetical protein
MATAAIGLALASTSAGAATTGLVRFANVVVMNVTGEHAVVQAGGRAVEIADGDAAPAMRLKEGRYDVSVATSGVRSVEVDVAGGCSALWLLLPPNADAPLQALHECPPARTEGEGTASIRVVNIAPHAPSVVLTIGSTITAATRPGEASPRVDVPAGQQRLDVRRTDLPGIIHTTAVTLAGGRGYVAVLAGGGENPVALLVVEDVGRQPPDPPSPDVPINTGPIGWPVASPAAALATASAATAALGLPDACRRVGLAMLLLLACTACGLSPRAGEAQQGPPPAARTTPSTTAPPPNSPPAPAVASPPVGVELGGTSAVVVPVASDAMADLPASLALTDVGWVAGTNPPSDDGMSMLVGHATFDDRGAFASLDELRAGDAVLVRRQDGSTVTYTVEESFAVPKEQFPGDVLYAPSAVPLLVLVSCTGPRSTVTGLHELNIVVIAS